MQRICTVSSVIDVYDELFDRPGEEPEEFSDESAYPIKQALEHSMRGGLVLECGCGPGRVVTHLAARGYRVVGMDIHRSSLRVLKRRHPEAMVVAADAAALPFKDDSFSTVLSFATLSYVSEQPSPRGFRRVLRPGGRLVTTMYHCNAFQFVLALRAMGSRKGKRFLMWCVSARQWRESLAEYGFRPQATEYTLYRFSVVRYLPWLARGRGYSYREMRDGDRVELTRAGELLWRLLALFPRLFANHYCVASVLEEADASHRTSPATQKTASREVA